MATRRWCTSDNGKGDTDRKSPANLKQASKGSYAERVRKIEGEASHRRNTRKAGRVRISVKRFATWLEGVLTRRRRHL